MNADDLRALQAPLKAKYRDDPASAIVTLRARGSILKDQLACRIERAHDGRPAGLHPAAGGDGSWACSGEMLLESLVACAGVTLSAVSTAMAIPIRSGTITAEGDLNFRGTLGIDKTAAVGMSSVTLKFELDTDASPTQLESLLSLTERYCVIYQTLKNGGEIHSEITTQSP